MGSCPPCPPQYLYPYIDLDLHLDFVFFHTRHFLEDFGEDLSVVIGGVLGLEALLLESLEDLLASGVESEETCNKQPVRLCCATAFGC